ncbi:MAG: Glyoxalase/bleomycin resistance protein/dioxygenase [Rhizobiaceae bacterium]|jgi:PhnB protein|nr:Glyoxalase/bleomycin resistance protein/dioxygenase [Rhizobiaceae bacterium]
MSEAAVTRQTASGAPLKGGVVPYLMLDGAADAVDFYKRALGAEEVGERAHMDDGRILNCRIDVNGGSVMLMDPMPEHGYPATTHDGYNLHLQVDDADRWFGRAVAAGCKVVMPMELQFWGDRYGMVKDPYGVAWAFGSKPAA